MFSHKYKILHKKKIDFQPALPRRTISQLYRIRNVGSAALVGFNQTTLLKALWKNWHKRGNQHYASNPNYHILN